MTKKHPLLLTVLTSFLMLFIFSQNSSAAVIYIGDQVMEKVADRLQDAELDHISVSPLSYDPNKRAGIENYSDWLPQAQQNLNSYPVDAVVISLGKVDLRLRSKSFPDTQTLDKAITNILDGVATSNAPIFWVIPHKNIAKYDHHREQRQLIINAINRAQASGKYQDFHIVDLDFWATQNNIELVSLLNRNKITFSSSGSQVAADIVVATVNELTAE
jgi:hypothetical protein